MKRIISVRSLGVSLAFLLAPLAAHAQVMGTSLNSTNTASTTTSQASSGGTGLVTGSAPGGNASIGGTGGTAQGVGLVTSLTTKTNVLAANSGAGSATTIPSSSNFMVNTYVNPFSLGLPSLYSTQYGAQNIISQSGGPKGKMTYLYVPAPTAANTATTTTTTIPGFSTVGVPRAPVYTTVLSQDLPLVQHNPSKLLSDVKGAIDRSSFVKDKSGIQVRVENNVAFLSGMVRSADDARRAEGLARSTPGILNVQNELQVVNVK